MTEGPCPPCSGCGLPTKICVCTLAPRLKRPTRVAVIMHVAERRKSSNTGRLVPLAWSNSFIAYRGMKDRPTDTQGMIPDGYQGVVLYPGEQAGELNQDFIQRFHRPLTLIVLDGSWSQAARMAKREPSLQGLPFVKLPPGGPSGYRLRKQSRDDRVCTFEAVAGAVGVVEGPAVQARLEKFFEIVIERILWHRGRLKKEEMAGVLPQSAGWG